MNLYTRLAAMLTSERASKLIFAFAVFLTVAAVAAPKILAAAPSGGGGSDNPVVTTAQGSDGKLQISATVSQTKIVQHSNTPIYVEVAVTPPASDGKAAISTPVDMVVVLDRSGSMAADNRLPYAKSAIKELLSRLNETDRFALVTFDTSAQIVTPLTAMNASLRSQQSSVVDSLTTGGSTNLSGGLDLAKSLLAGSSAGRTRKVILLSDGEANMGITDNNQLSILARSFSQSESILSTVGVGLGFNEVLLSSLADNGMGNFSFLEHLASLGEILQKDLKNTREVYAGVSGLEIAMPKGVKLIDASGYPQQLDAETNRVRLLTGQLLNGVRKSFFLTFQAPSETVGSLSIGDLTFNYSVNSAAYEVKLNREALMLAVVEPARESEAFASVNQTLFKKSWTMNNLGRMQQEFSKQLRAGNAQQASAVLNEYRADIGKFERAYKMKIADSTLTDELDAMSGTVGEVKAAPPAAAQELSNRAAKSMLVKGKDAQRGK